MYEDLKIGETYKTFKLTASGEEVLKDFSKEGCDMFDDINLYLNDSIKTNLLHQFEEFVSKIDKEKSKPIQQ